MVDQHEALAVTAGVTDSLFGSPYQDLKRQPSDQQAATLHFTTKLSRTWVLLLREILRMIEWLISGQ